MFTLLDPHASRPVFEFLEGRLLLAAGEVVRYLPPQYDLLVPGEYLTGPSDGSPVEISLGFLSSHADELGLRPEDVLHSIVTDQYTTPDTGLTHIYLRQEFRGLEVANANFVVNVAADGRVVSASGGFVGKLAAAEALGLLAAPVLSAADALRNTAAWLGLEPSSTPVLMQPLSGTDTIAVLADGNLSLDPIPARLYYLATPDGVELAWNLVLRTPDGDHWYDMGVDTDGGQVLLASDWVHEASYTVYALPTEMPDDGGRTVVTDPYDPTASPYGWHDTNGSPGAEYTDTRGNNVFAQEDRDANDTGGFRPAGGAGLAFDFPLDLAQAPLNYQSAAITNLFYWNNLLHDIHYRYGFTEAAGNFQQTNYTGAGMGNDPVQADAQDGSGTNNANIAVPPDGQSPRMQMFEFTYTTPRRDGDLDNMIIVHEYGHGVSERVVGGPSNVNALLGYQSGGMGEGWSDWWGLMFTQKATDTKMASYAVGTYVLGQPPTGEGIRRQPYSFDMSVDPQTYGSYNSSHEVHDCGEIWASVLWDLNWLLIDRYGFDPNIAAGYTPGGAGNLLALQLVMDSLAVMPVNPTFLDGRDAILQADLVRTGGANQDLIWQAYARRGMGYSAYDGGSADATTVVEAFDLPSPDPVVLSHTPTGSLAPTAGSMDFVFNEAMWDTSFSVAEDVASFTGPGGTDLKPQIIGGTWLDSRTLHITFAPQSAVGTYQMIIGPQILANDNHNPMDQNRNGTLGEVPADQYTASFTIVSLIYQTNMDSNPGWTFDAGTAPYQWQYGIPTGNAGDPTAGHTGTNVVGYNLTGAYPNSMSSTQYATTPTFSTLGYQNVKLSFWRWLGVESATFDQASIQAWDGTTWTTVWNHTGGSFQDSSWTKDEYTLPSSFNNKSAVSIRWGMGPTDSSVTYSGWNIDDVLVMAMPMSPLSVTVNQASGQADPTNGAPINFSVVFNEPVTDFATGDVTLSGTVPGTLVGTVSGSGTTYNVAVSGMTGSGTVIATLGTGVAHDASGNPNNPSASTDNVVTYDVTAPTVTINQASGQADPTGNSPINFTVVFNETVTDFATGDVTLGGTAPGTLVGAVTGSGTTCNVAVSGMTGAGTVTATLAAGVAHDAAGNPNAASTSTDNTVTYVVTPMVTINQAPGQADPTGASPINFTVVFNKTVTDFATGDVTLGGTAPGTLVGTVSGSGTTYNVALSGMTGSGTVVATIAAGVAHDGSGNPNLPSTSTDNTVTYDVTPPAVMINQAATQADPTSTSPINFTVVFTETVTGFATGDVTLSGTAPGTLVGAVTGSGTTYNVAVSGMTGSGTVIATIAASRAQDTAGNPNTASTSTDNTVTFTYVPPIYSANMDANPGWTTGGQWAFGHPTGGGGTSYGNPDPVNGYTGSNVYGVNLAGDYSTTVGGPYYVTTGTIDCSGYTGVQLAFMRWLNTDYLPFVNATVDVSNNGTTWSNIYTNPSGTEVADNAWQSMSYGISAVADGRSTVYLRWGYQVLDTGAYAYSGWNIDDVTVTGTPTGPDIAGPMVAVQTPSGTVPPGQTSMQFGFNEPMDTTSFAVADDVVTFTGPGGANLKPQITGFTWVDTQTLRVAFSSQTATGAYTMVIGPNITDDGPSFNPMNQDGDATNGETPDDRYSASFTISIVSALVGVDFDLVGGSKPVNWTQWTGGAGTILSNLMDETGAATPFDLTLAGSFTGYACTPASTTLPIHTQSLAGLDGYVYGSSTWTFTWGDLTPGSTYEVYTFGLRGFSSANNITITGGGTPISFTQTLVPNMLHVNDEQGSSSRQLSSFAETVTADSAGHIVITVSGSSTLAMGGLGIRQMSGPTTGRIEGDKWNDLDGDGVRDAGEPTLAGWTIYLDADTDGTLDPGEPTQVTNAAGHYVFSGLAAGTYTVREVVQTGWQQTSPGGARLFEVRASGTVATIVEVDPTTGSVLNSFAAPAPLTFAGPQGLALGPSSLFYLDGSGTGPHTLWELNPNTGAVIDSDVVDAAAPTEIAGVGFLNGKVYLEQDVLNNIVVWDPVLDVPVTTLPVSADLIGGLTGAADRGVLYDSNGAGQIFKIDPTTGAVLATLSPGVGPLSGGLAYVSGELVAAKWSTSSTAYRINPDTGVVLGTLALGGTGYICALGGDGVGGGGAYVVTLAAGQVVTGKDFGNQQQSGRIEGDKWNDLDGDGVRDAGEPALAGWTIYLDTDTDGTLDPGEPTQVTNAAGHYVFAGLTPGAYTVREVVQTNWTQTSPSTSGQRLFELRVAGTAGTISEVDPSTGAVIRTFAAPGTIGGIGWQGLAMGPSSLFYIEGYGAVAHTLYELNPDTGAILDSDVVDASSPASIDGLGYLNGKVYIQRTGTTQIYVWDPVLDVALPPLTVSAALYGGMTGAADLNVLFATDSPGNIYKLNPTTGTVLGTFAPGYGLLAGVAYTNGQLIVSPYATTGMAYRLNPATGAVLGSFTLGGTGTLTALGGDGAGAGGAHTVILTGGQVVTGKDFGNRQVSAVPTAPDLDPGSDRGQLNIDNITNLDNGGPSRVLQFLVGGTFPGATVTIYADGTPIGSAKAPSGDTTLVTTDGLPAHDLVDGPHTITARQTEPGKQESADSSPLTLRIDTLAPTATVPDLNPASDTGLYSDDNVTQGGNPQFDGTAGDPASGGYASGLWQVVVGSDDGKSGLAAASPYSVVLPTLNEGSRTVTATAYDVAGNQFTTAPLALTVDRTAPRVTAFGVSSSSAQWVLGTVDSGMWRTGRMAAMAPWSRINRYVLDFNENVLADATDMTLVGNTVGSVVLAGPSGSGTSRLTWNSAAYLTRDRYQLRLASGAAGAQDLAGNVLDGDGLAGMFPSGDGTPGGDWLLGLNVLVADVTGDGVVNTLDKARVSLKYGTVIGGPLYSALVDINGDGVINVLDKAQASTHFGETLPAPLASDGKVGPLSDEAPQPLALVAPEPQGMGGGPLTPTAIQTAGVWLPTPIEVAAAPAVASAPVALSSLLRQAVGVIPSPAAPPPATSTDSASADSVDLLAMTPQLDSVRRAKRPVRGRLLRQPPQAFRSMVAPVRLAVAERATGL